MENSSIIEMLWEGVRSYLQVKPDVFIFAGAFVLGFIFCVLALAITGPGGRTTRSSVRPWVVLAGLCALGPMVLGLYRYGRALSAVKRLSPMVPTEPSVRLIIVAPLIIAGLILFINGILYLIALGRYSKLPKSLPADQTTQAQARPGSAGPLFTGLVIFLLLFIGAGVLVGAQVLKAKQTLAAQAQPPVEQTIPAPPEGQPDVTAKIPEQGVEGGILGGVEGGIEGGVVGGVPGEITSGGEESYVRITDNAPRCITEVAPVYPEIAKTARIAGVVILEVKVDKDGNVVNTQVLRSIPLLDQAAIDAVKQWKYEPFLVNGEPRAFILTVTVNFNLT
jgi:TonB family protein